VPAAESGDERWPGRLRFIDRKRTFPKPLPISTQVLLDRERCVLCQRCTRFSDEIAGDPFIELLERGSNQQIGVAQDNRSSPTSPATPSRSARRGSDQRGLPVPLRPFDLYPRPRSASTAVRLRPAQRHASGHRAAPDGRQRPEVNEEWNCDKAGSRSGT